ncbi:hypothetical protein N657DRAFT_306825 [Parathielavia appendiculata]|uniref:Uncharacterized protein n=1 Tax=Parathielavia appendiculata TaxID=2587402 RepID=A0AAN6U590_9PEZI|nr:hypothetical protein N657DRAFT_306825 [Parathielavia appendiculata]
MPLDETLDLASEEPRGRSNGDSGVERNPQVTGEATLLKELVAELRALNENIGQLGHLKDLSDQLPRIQSILDEAYPQRPLQQHARPEAGVDQETQDKEGTNEAGESGELAQEPPQQQSPQELEVNRDEAEIGGGGERSTLDHPRRKVGEKVVPEIEAQSDPYHGDTGEDDNNNPSASIDSRRQGEFDTMVALDSKLLPSPESLVSIRQRLEEAVSPCCCHERVTWSAVANDPREAGHHAFQDVVLAVPASLPSASGLMEITLHPTTDAATPRVRGQLEDCREFIKTSWPRHPGESDDERDFSSASGVVTVERGPFWFFRGANHDCLTNFRFYVLSSQHRLLLTTPKWAQCDGKSPQTKVTSIRVPGCHPDFEWWRNSDEEMHIGRLWYAYQGLRLAYRECCDDGISRLHSLFANPIRPGTRQRGR